MTSLLNIAMLAACPYPTGQGTQALIGELARGMTALGHHIHLVSYAHGTMRRDEAFSLHATPALPGYRRVRSGPDLVKPLIDAMMVKTALTVVRKYECQLIHAHNYEGALVGYLVSRLSGVPLLYHAHNWMSDELPRYFQLATMQTAARYMGVILDKTIPRMAHRIIALHERMAQEITSFGVSRHKIMVVEPGIDPEPWLASKSSKEDHLVLYAGNLDSYQNIGLAFDAMAIVVEELPTARLLIATPNDPALARRMISAHGAGDWCESVHTPDSMAAAKEYARAKVALCPRTSPSGFPIKTLNAMAAGVPVVACNSGSWGVIPGKTGQVVDDDDPESMARAIVQLLINDSHRSMLADAARDSVRARYSNSRMCEEVEKVWLSVLQG